MTTKEHMVQCLLCDEQFKMGPDQYDGKWLPRYQMHVCSTCYAGNWDGYADHSIERIVSHLKSKRIPLPPLNKKGNLPRD